MNLRTPAKVLQRVGSAMAPASEDATEPLLALGNGPVADVNGDGAAEKPQSGVWAAEFRHILVLSAPAIVQLCTQQALVITNQARCLRRSHATAHLQPPLPRVC